MKRPWLFAEGLVLLGPLTVYVVVCSVLAVGIGLPALILGETKIALILPMAALLPGIFALGYLWFLTVRTALGFVHAFDPDIDPSFLIASLCGVFASITVIWLAEWWAALLILLGCAQLGHVLLLQKTMRVKSGAQQVVPADGLASLRSARRG